MVLLRLDQRVQFFGEENLTRLAQVVVFFFWHIVKALIGLQGGSQRREGLKIFIHELLIQLSREGVEFWQISRRQMTCVLEQELQFVVQILCAFDFLGDQVEEKIRDLGILATDAGKN